MNKNMLLIMLLGLLVILLIIGCCNIKNKRIDNQLVEINNRITDYFLMDDIEYTNLSFNYIDSSQNKVIVGLYENTKEQQDEFKRIVVNSNLIVFVDSKGIDNQLVEINNRITDYFLMYNIEYTNLSFNYIDSNQNKVIVGLYENTKEQQDEFKRIVVNSNLIVFIDGKENIDLT